MNLFVAHQVEAIAAQLVQHMPSLTKDVEKLGKFCFDRLSEQSDLLGFISDALTPEAVKAKPWWGYVATDRTGGEVRVRAPKRVAEAVEVPQHLFNFVSILGLLMTPTTRGVLGVCGIRVKFFQCDADAPAPKILS